jgi:hypothetical protein
MASDNSNVQFSYMWPGLLFLIGIPFLLFHGLAPYDDLISRRDWVPVKATLERGQVVSKDAPDSIVLKDTGTQYKIKLVLRYSPRSLLGPAAMNQQYPPWLLLPKLSFHWTIAPEVFSSLLEAHAALREYQRIRDFELYMNPGQPDEATLFRWNRWTMIFLGAGLWIVSLLGFGFLWIINTRTTKRRLSEEEEMAKFRARRHHRRGGTSGTPGDPGAPDGDEQGEEEPNTGDTIHE